jgi:tRNA pseudouridine38-40 synthase
MARYKLILAYDGTDFSGSQRQARRRTVQAELEKALRPLGWKSTGVALAGRTDAGVHAIGQVAGFDLDWAHGTDRLRRALNARLPLDLAVKAVEVAGEGFHPRFDAKTRRYRYQVYCEPDRDPLRDRCFWRLWPPVPLRLLSSAAKVFLGRHDFAAFGSAPRKNGVTIRTVTASKWSGSNEEMHFDVAADGFLYRMVRRMIFLQVAVARGLCSEESIVVALATAARRPDLPAGLAPAAGLILSGVDY